MPIYTPFLPITFVCGINFVCIFGIYNYFQVLIDDLHNQIQILEYKNKNLEHKIEELTFEPTLMF